MTSLGRLLPVLLGLMSAAAVHAEEGLDGIWPPMQPELSGRALPPPVLKAIVMTIHGDRYHVVVQTEQGPSPDDGTLILEPGAAPKGMTIAGTKGPNAGKSFPAIYEISGDTLRICYDLSGRRRPSEFKTLPRTKLYLVSYRRQK